MLTVDSLLSAIEAYLARTRMSATAFGREAVGDAMFVHDLRKKGREPRSRLIRKVEAYMAKEAANTSRKEVAQ